MDSSLKTTMSRSVSQSCYYKIIVSDYTAWFSVHFQFAYKYLIGFKGMLYTRPDDPGFQLCHLTRLTGILNIGEKVNLTKIKILSL